METVKLTGSKELTRKMAVEAGIKEGKFLDDMVDISKGNPGTMHYLLELTELAGPFDSIAMPCLLSVLGVKNIKGSYLYAHIKSMGGPREAYQKFVELGWM